MGMFILAAEAWQSTPIFKERKKNMKIRTKIKAGTRRTEEEHNHNQTAARGLKVKTNVKAGIMENQHNQTVAHGLKVKTGIKAGPGPSTTPPPASIR